MRATNRSRAKVKPIESFPVLPTWIVVFTHLGTAARCVSYMATTAKDFFLLQYLRKFKLIKIPLVHVDHPLDEKIPFTPSRIGNYMSFVSYWIRPLTMLIKTFGTKKAVPLLERYLKTIKSIYKEAASVYRNCMSTTNRPHYKRRIYFAAIHMLDPHYMCVPSLHIAVVLLCISFFGDLFKNNYFTREQTELWQKEIYDGGIRIAETVLYVKQHSVNCVPAAAYMMSRIVPELFSKEDALKFLDGLFLDAKNIRAEDCVQIREYMKGLFCRFHEEGAAASDWSLPVTAWLKEKMLIKTKNSADNSKYGKPE